MSNLTYTKESTGDVIKRAILGALAGLGLVGTFIGGYTLGGYIQIPQKSAPQQLQIEQEVDEEVLWNLQLVNKENRIPADHEIKLVELRNGEAVDVRIYPDLQEMMNAARSEGLSPIICSSYRSHEKQIALYNEEINEYVDKGYAQEEAIREAAKWVAMPGTSEHELGLAVDIVAQDYQLLDEKQVETEEQRWLMANSYKYGFILRYPESKSEITGILYEPWHYRYVGKEAAKQIVEREVCLEEYLADLDSYALSE